MLYRTRTITLQNEIITNGDGWYLTIRLETIVLLRLMYVGRRVWYVYKGISIIVTSMQET